MPQPAEQPSVLDVRGFAIPLIRRIVAECPRRLAGTESERRAHQMVADAFEGIGVATRFHEFTHNTSLYATMALHFGIAVLGTALLPVSPALALALHVLVAISYWGDSTKRFMLLRRLFPYRRSQNLIATLPAIGEPRLRVVLVAHIDAAFTGLIFEPKLIKLATQEPPIKALRFLRKSLLTATASVALLAALDVWVWVSGLSTGLWIAALLLSIPSLLTCVANLDVVVRNHVVPGANDNLTGSVGAVALAQRLRDKPDDVEILLVVTGAEEAGTGGAWALSRDAGWSRETTVILGIDTLSGGELRWLRDGELVTRPVAQWLESLLERVSQSDPRYARAEGFDIPSGASDAMPFLSRGYQGVSIGCVDPDIGAPRNYHHPSDTPDNLDPAQFEVTLDFITDVAREVIRERR